jgi:hypothetical protein
MPTSQSDSFPDRILRHRLQPQALDRFFAFRMAHDVTENELPLAARVAGIDDTRDVLALEQLDEEPEALFRALDGPEIEVRGNHRQVCEGPLASLDLYALGRNQLQQVPDRGRKHVLAALVVVAVAREAAESAGDVVRHGRFFGDDELFGHGKAKTARDRIAVIRSVLREAQNDKRNRKTKQGTAARHRRERRTARGFSALAGALRRESARREPARRHFRGASTAPSAR